MLRASIPRASPRLTAGPRPKSISWRSGLRTICSPSDWTISSEEIIRLPNLAHMPLGPRSLLGLANLRGVVLPVVATRRLLELPDAPLNENTRVVSSSTVARRSGFVVDRIDLVLALPAERVEKDDSGAGLVNPDVLDGIVKGAEVSTIKILNPQRLLRDDCSPRRPERAYRRASLDFSCRVENCCSGAARADVID